MFEESRAFDRAETEHSLSSLTLTPLIDIVFLLLIFFMVSTTFTVQPGLKINLPRSGGEVKVPEQRAVISLTARGAIYLNDRSVGLKQLREALRKHPKSVVLRADKSVPHGYTVKILDTIRKVGVGQVSLSTRPVEKNE